MALLSRSSRHPCSLSFWPKPADSSPAVALLLPFFAYFAHRCIKRPVIIDIDRHVCSVGFAGFVQNDLASACPALELFIAAHPEGHDRLARLESNRQQSESAARRRVAAFDFSCTTGHARF